MESPNLRALVAKMGWLKSDVAIHGSRIPSMDYRKKLVVGKAVVVDCSGVLRCICGVNDDLGDGVLRLLVAAAIMGSSRPFSMKTLIHGQRFSETVLCQFETADSRSGECSAFGIYPSICEDDPAYGADGRAARMACDGP